MQSGDGTIRYSGRQRDSASGDTEGDELDQADQSEQPESIRDLQRRRRDAGRYRTEIEALLATPQEESEEEDEDEGDVPPPGTPPPARVFVVFRGVEWQDPSGVLRESDTIVGVFATEAAARAAVAEINRVGSDQEDAWYQPYNVQS
ncbi:MAG TPA: hypothetical protein VGW38_21475 [Chloroflexota bacterium]|nr:hypothetical protein [Chloroflexota bacterium]